MNPWPRPLQQPHPPVWLPGSGSFETIKKAAERRYPFMMVFAPQWFTKANYDMYRRAAEEAGYEASPKQLAAAIPTYVAETEEQAHREAKPHIMWLFQNGLKIPPYHWFPPGYTSKKSFAGMLGAKIKHNMKDHWELTYEELLEERYIIVGSPETVIERLTEFTDDLGAGIVLGAGGHMGSMPHWHGDEEHVADGGGGDPRTSASRTASRAGCAPGATRPRRRSPSTRPRSPSRGSAPWRA